MSTRKFVFQINSTERLSVLVPLQFFQVCKKLESFPFCYWRDLWGCQKLTKKNSKIKKKQFNLYWKTNRIWNQENEKITEGKKPTPINPSVFGLFFARSKYTKKTRASLRPLDSSQTKIKVISYRPASI